MTDGKDIIDIILEDHKPLKRLLQIMKNDDKDADIRQGAFEEFAPLLVNHAKPEERALYEFMKKNEELRGEAFEGDTEHGLADQLIESVKRCDDEDERLAMIKVLAELVEHHLEEEEGEIFPDVRKEIDPKQRMELGRRYLQFQDEITMEGNDDAPYEREIESTQQL